MLNSLLRIAFLAISSMFIYRYRFRMINYVFANPTMRKMAVRLFMNVPFVRDRMAGQMFRFQ